MSQPKVAKAADDKPMHDDAVPSHDHMAGLKRISFDFDQFTLSAEARSILGENAKYLQANSGTKVVIEGHCDERGSDEYNLALGESRALAAKSYLISLGISAKRLSVISYGEEKPLSNASGESAWAQNRRAEFKAVN
jgi:peptidoglycan-associated lipoprotein